MELTDLKSIKTRSIKEVFYAIAAKDKTTRAEIAKATSLSLMTVGKIADALARIKITTEEKEPTNTVGRRASTIRIAPVYYGIVLDLSDEIYTCEIVDAGANILDRFSYVYDQKFYKEENLILFYRNLALYLSERHDPDKCMGIAILLSDNPPASDISFDFSVSEAATVEQAAKDALIQYCIRIQAHSRTEAAAVYTAKSTQENEQKILLYCHVGKEITSTLVVRGEIATGLHRSAGNIGYLSKSTEESTPKEETATARQIERAIRQAQGFMDPHLTVIEIGRSQRSLAAHLEHAFAKEDHHPTEICSEGLHHSHAGAVIRMREEWINSIISQEM